MGGLPLRAVSKYLWHSTPSRIRPMSEHHIGPRPLATYDPAADGHTPVPVGGTITALQRVVDCMWEAREALAGCTTPLNLLKADEDLAMALVTTEEALDQLLRAVAHIEADEPLADSFPGEDPWWENRKTVVLSPRQILALADRADQVIAADHVTYREVILAADNPTPTIAAKARRQVEYAERRTERERLHDLILEDIENQACPMCGAKPGDYCRTRTGRVGGPHAGRKKASPLALENPGVAKTVVRQDVELEQLYLEEQRERAEYRQQLLEDREILNDVVEELANQFALKDRL